VAGLSKLRSIPSFVTPMAAHAVAKLPEGSEWLYELKLDGSPYSVTVSAARNDEVGGSDQRGKGSWFGSRTENRLRCGSRNNKDL
jgi:hypothetical protein